MLPFTSIHPPRSPSIFLLYLSPATASCMCCDDDIGAANEIFSVLIPILLRLNFCCPGRLDFLERRVQCAYSILLLLHCCCTTILPLHSCSSLSASSSPTTHVIYALLLGLLHHHFPPNAILSFISQPTATEPLRLSIKLEFGGLSRNNNMLQFFLGGRRNIHHNSVLLLLAATCTESRVSFCVSLSN